jgi:hypothetical protein
MSYLSLGALSRSLGKDYALKHYSALFGDCRSLVLCRFSTPFSFILSTRPCLIKAHSSQLVGSMFSTLTGVPGPRYSLSLSNNPTMGPASSQPSSKSRTSEPCQLHKPNDRNINLEFLQRNDIWLGRGALIAEKLILFYTRKVPAENRLVPTSENLERLVYCGSCFKYQVDNPLTFTPRYVQKKGERVTFRILPKFLPSLTVSLGSGHSLATR